MAESTHRSESWSQIPSHLLYAELKRRQDEGERPACGSGGSQDDYDLGLHVFALFLILFVSFFACAFPIIARRWPKLPIPHYFLFISRHFGTGVLIATAFVHLLPTAFTSLHDPCLPSFWNDGYPPMPGLIAMLAVFIVVGIEMFFATRGAGHIHTSDYDAISPGTPMVEEFAQQNKRSAHQQSFSPDSNGFVDGQSTVHVPAQGHSAAHNPDIISPRSSISDDDGPVMLSPSISAMAGRQADSTARPSLHRHSSSHHHTVPSDPTQASALEKKLLLQCLLLEAGILFHSVFIGIALSVSTGPAFIVLLIAITFHQTFEGLALGSRIAAIPTLSPSSPKPWLMAVAYGTTTPIGQAIGLGVHRLYDPASQVGLLMVGTMNAVSSGLLLFAGLVELLAEDFLSDASYRSLKGRRRKEACAAVVAGAGLMSLVGAWA